MTEVTKTFPAPPQRRGAKVYTLLFDSPDKLAAAAESSGVVEKARSEFYGNLDLKTTLRYTREGDLSGVAASEALLAEMEHYVFETARLENVLDVTGASPNVPAYIAGQPLSMRRRARREHPQGPIAVIVDLSTSAELTTKQIQTRGAVLLALVRILSTCRPVELWAVTGLDGRVGRSDPTGVSFVGTRIDTTPLDLARAGFILTSAAFPRMLCYGLAEKHHGYRGHWPFYDGPLSPSEMAQCLMGAFAHVEETLCVPGLHVKDELVQRPLNWLQRELLARGARRLQDEDEADV